MVQRSDERAIETGVRVIGSISINVVSLFPCSDRGPPQNEGRELTLGPDNASAAPCNHYSL
jgi:hypothetical protein